MGNIDAIITLPQPTGPYRIGTARYDLEDAYRKNFQFPKGRLIPIQICFPMEQGKHSIYLKISEERAALGSFEALKANGYSRPADLSLLLGDQHPVVIINHASCAAMTDYAFLGEDLASHGYVVISIQHDLKSEEEEPSFWEGRSCSRNAKIVDNLLYAFEWLKTTHTTLFQEKINLKRVGLIGHSLGANSLLLLSNRTLDMFQQDNRSALLPRLDQNDVKECLVLMEATRFSFPFNSHYPLFFLLAEEREVYHKKTGCYEQMTGAGHQVCYYKGSTHISFMDQAYIHPKQHAGPNEHYFHGTSEERRAFFECVRKDVRLFLKTHGV